MGFLGLRGNPVTSAFTSNSTSTPRYQHQATLLPAAAYLLPLQLHTHPFPPRQMLNSPLIAHHLVNPYTKYRFGMTSSSARSPLNDWSQSYGFAGALDAPSPPPPVGQPLLDTQQQIFFDQFFEQMPSNMIPSVNPAHIFDPDMPKDTALWPESVPRGFPTSVHDMSSEALSAASNTSGFFGNHSVTSSPAVTDINPFDGSHQLLQPRQQDHTAINATPLLNFGTDTNFAPNGYHPPPPPVTLPDKDTEIRSKIYSALTKNESRITTAVNSPAEIKYEGSGDDMSPLREDESTSPQMGMGMVLGTKRRADDVDDFLPSKAARKPRPSAESALKHKKKSIAGPKRDNLSEAQKRENHIHSEQKRRNLIRQGFEELCALVPELKAGGYSKSAVLIHAANYLDDLKKGNAKLRLYLQQLEGARAY